jgi:hypothetical protein
MRLLIEETVTFFSSAACVMLLVSHTVTKRSSEVMSTFRDMTCLERAQRELANLGGIPRRKSEKSDV